MDTGAVSCAPAAVHHGKTGKVQGRDRVGIVEGSCGYRARGVSIRGKFILSRNLENKTRGSLSLPVAKLSSDPRVADPDVKVHVRHLVRVVGIVAPSAPRGSVPGEIRFIETQWVNGHRRPVSGAASRGTPRESQTNFRYGTVWGL